MSKQLNSLLKLNQTDYFDMKLSFDRGNQSLTVSAGWDADKKKVVEGLVICFIQGIKTRDQLTTELAGILFSVCRTIEMQLPDLSLAYKL